MDYSEEEVENEVERKAKDIKISISKNLIAKQDSKELPPWAVFT